MLAHITRDAPKRPALAATLAPWLTFVAMTRDGLLEGWGDRGPRSLLVAAVTHALRFETWQSLTHDGELCNEDAVELMIALSAAAGTMVKAELTPTRQSVDRKCLSTQA